MSSPITSPNDIHRSRDGDMHEDESSTTFKSKQMADAVINPLLDEVDIMRRRRKDPFSIGWLNRLRNWLSRMERGSFANTRSGVFAHLSFPQIAKLMLAICNRGKEKALQQLKSVGYLNCLLEVERHQSEKIGYRGHFPPASEWLDAKIAEVWKDKPPLPNLNVPALERACEWFSKLVPPNTVRVGHSSWVEGLKDAGTDRESEKSLDITTNGCYAYYTKGWYVRPEMMDKVPLARKQTAQLLKEQARKTWEYLWNLKSYKDCKLTFVATASQRTNVASANGPLPDGSNVYHGQVMSKLRAVCALPKIDTICGKPILNRLLEVAREIRNPDGSRMFAALMHPSIIDKNMETILQTAAKNELIPLSTDFTGFDASVPPWFAMKAAEAVSHWMDKQTAKIWMSLIKTEFYNTYCITTDKIFDRGPSSVKSGGITTNFIDSCVNLISQRYGLEAGHYQTILAQTVQGDDAVLLGDGVNPETFEAATAEIGLVGNKDKQFYVKDALSFCQKTYFRGIPGGIYPISRATASCVSTEDDVPVWDSLDGHEDAVFAYRLRCRLDTACFNPYFVALVNAIVVDDRRFHLGKGIPASELAVLAGSYAKKMERERFLKPHKAANRSRFEDLPINRVLRGDLPPTDAYARFKWVYGIDYRDVAL